MPDNSRPEDPQKNQLPLRVTEPAGDPQPTNLERTTDLQATTGRGATDSSDATHLMANRPEGYEWFGEIARGGMGAIIHGRDSDLGREVAFKVLLGDHRDRPKIIERFLEEAQIGGQLQHPGVVPVYERGMLPDERPYFTMKLVKGQSLTELLQSRQDPSEDLPRFLGIFEHVCQTVAYAHSRGVIHRDLKPLNIMVGAFGEVQVMDWGLAKVLAKDGRADADSLQDLEIATVRTNAGERSQVGSVVGTPAYMPPEQAKGAVDLIDERADVFGLGAILCEVLTGKPPYLGRSSAEVFRNASQGALTDAFQRLDSSRADGELVGLAKRCLEVDLEQRLRDARQVVDAIGSYMNQVQERLRQAELAQAKAETKAIEERKRRKVTSALAASILLMLLGASLAGLWYQHDRVQTAKRVEQVEREMDLALTEAERTLADITEQLQDRIRAVQLNPDQWAADLRKAEVDARRAKALMDNAEHPVRSITEQRLREVQRQLQTKTRHHQLAKKLEKIRLDAAAIVDGRFDPVHVAIPNYVRVFIDANFDVDREQASKLAHKIGRSSIRWHLVAALDDWAFRDTERRDHLLRVVNEIDSENEWRQRFGDVSVWGDRKQLERFASEEEVLFQSPQLIFALASLLRERGGDARPLLRAALGRYPRDFWLSFELANQLQDTGESEGFYLTALVLRPNTSAVHNNLGAVYHRRGEFDLAIQQFYKALQLAPEVSQNLYNLGLAHAGNGEFDLAIKRYERALELDSGLADEFVARVYSSLGTAYAELGKSNLAIEQYQQGMLLRPGHAEDHYDLGTVYMDQHKLDLAIEQYKIAIKLDPKDARFHTNLGIAYTDKGELDLAVQHFREAIDIDSTLVRIHVNLGLAYRKKGELGLAVDQLREAITINPKDASAYSALGMVYKDQDKLELAIEQYQIAIQLDAKDADTYSNLGKAYSDQGELDLAIKQYRKAVQLDPEDANARFNLGNLYGKSSKAELAITQYEKTIELDPKFAQAYYGVGVAYASKGELDVAIEHYRKTIRLDPNYAEAYYALGTVYLNQDKLALAIEQYGKAIQVDPNHAEAHCNMGHALQAQGNFAEALISLNKGHELGLKRGNRWRYPSAQWIRACKELQATDLKLTTILQGKAEPQDAQEQVALASFCQRYKQRYHQAFKFYKDAFTRAPKLAEDLDAQHRYDAACAASLANAGQGIDTKSLNTQGRIALREQALNWLEADLTAYAKLVESDNSQLRKAIYERLTHWLKDNDLTGIRDAKMLTTLPAKEQEVFLKFWSDVAALRNKAQANN